MRGRGGGGRGGGSLRTPISLNPPPQGGGVERTTNNGCDTKKGLIVKHIRLMQRRRRKRRRWRSIKRVEEDCESGKSKAPTLGASTLLCRLQDSSSSPYFLHVSSPSLPHPLIRKGWAGSKARTTGKSPAPTLQESAAWKNEIENIEEKEDRRR